MSRIDQERIPGQDAATGICDANRFPRVEDSHQSDDLRNPLCHRYCQVLPPELRAGRTAMRYEER